MKRKFFAVHEYGMGGVWVCLLAGSREEVVARYPDLKVFEGPPDWMSDEMAQGIEKQGVFDIDGPPEGFLRYLAQKKP